MARRSPAVVWPQAVDLGCGEGDDIHSCGRRGHQPLKSDFFKVADRVCTCIEVVHPVPRRNFRFHLARIFVDDELNLPIRYESYSWPTTPGGAPELIEEYTYLDLKLNVGLTDSDFDIQNPNYQF
jgi:hypothetical protein